MQTWHYPVVLYPAIDEGKKKNIAIINNITITIDTTIPN